MGEDRIVEKINSFKKVYSEELELKISLLEDAYIDAYASMNFKTAKEGFLAFKEVLERAYSLNDLSNKIEKIKRLKNIFEHEIIDISNKLNITKGNNDENTKKAVDRVLDCLNDIVYFLKTKNDENIKIIKSIMEDIINIPFGQEENKTKNALEFQRKVIELFSWLFIDEMRLLERNEIKQEQLSRDGIFEIVRGNFDFERRDIERLNFTHIVMECKNYKKPSYDDLMQVYAYILLNKIYPIADNPLCIIVSRENPSRDSVVWKMQEKLFEKDGNKYLLILFLSCEDLSEMCELREHSGDPFMVLKKHIDGIVRRNITREI